MKKTKLILLLTIIMSIFISIYSVNYAVDDPNATTTQNDAETEAVDKAKSKVNDFLTHIGTVKFKENAGYYAINVGKQGNLKNKYGLDVSGGGNSGLCYEVAGTDGIRRRVDIQVTATVTIPKYEQDPNDPNLIVQSGTLTFNSSKLWSTNEGLQFYFESVKDSSTKKDVKQSDGKLWKNQPLVEIEAGGKKVLVPTYALNDGTISYSYQVTGETSSAALIQGGDLGNLDHKGKSIWELLKSWYLAIVEWGLDKISQILNLVLLGIAKGLRYLINSLVGENISVGSIVYGTSKKFDIDFWSSSLDSSSIAYKMSDVVSKWYNYFKGFGITIYLIMLLYMGVKILLSSTGKGMETAKQTLSAWMMGIVLLFSGPFIMRYIVKINNGLVGIVAEKRKEDAAATGKAEDMMAFIEGKAIENNSIMLTIVYLIMIGQLIVLIGTYYKRAFHIAFLIIIYPIIATYYIWERSKGSGGRKSGSKAYEAWVKEFIVLVFTQLVHAVVYAVLIEGMYDALLTDAGGNYILYILCVTFLFKAEGIAKQIFNVRSTAGTLGDLAQSGAAAFAITKSVTSVFKKADGGASAQDEKEAQETNKQVNTLRNANTANAIRKQVESEEANNRQSQGNAQGAGAGPGGGSGGPSGTSGGLGGGNGNGGPNGPGNVGNTVPVVNMQTIGANQQDQTNVSMQMNGSGVMAPQGNNQNTIQQNTTAQNQKRVAARGQMTDLEKMRLVQRQKALQAKTGGKGRKIAKFAVRNLGRTAGIAAGLALGAAQGNMSSAISNAANFGMIGARLGNGVTRIADVGIGRFAGARMRLKSERGDFKEDFKAAGVSEEFIEEVYNNARGEAIRKALASEASGVRRGGKALGDVKFTGTIERETRS